MSKASSQPTLNSKTVSIEAQLSTTINPLFPLYSPTVDDPYSPGTSARTASSSQPILNYSTRPMHEEEEIVKTHNVNANIGAERALRRNMMEENSSMGQGLENRIHEWHVDTRRKVRPNLHIVTGAQHKPVKRGEVTLNNVAVKHPETRHNKATSVISQAGIRVGVSPPDQKDIGELSSGLKKWINTKRSNVPVASKFLKPARGEKQPNENGSRGMAFKSTQERTRETEPLSLQNGIMKRTVAALRTPKTPRIVITPADEKHMEHLGPSPSSLYSSIYETESITPVTQKRLSSESQRQILPESGVTGSPKSQGWWNIVLSPVLSRAGTLRNRKATAERAPPVPPINTDVNKDASLPTPFTVMSPQTPRRLGMASVRSSTWTQWTEEDDSRLPQHDLEEHVPTIPREYLAQSANHQAHYIASRDLKVEGLPADDFHTCSMEQPAGISCFCCINRSCQDHKLEWKRVGDKIEACPRCEAAKMVESRGIHIESKEASYPSCEAALKDDSSKQISSKPDTVLSHHKLQSLDSTNSETDLDNLVSPNIRQANTAVFSRARKVNSREPSPAPASMHAKPGTRTEPLKLETMMAGHAVDSPGPLSPEGARAIEPAGGVPMAPVQSQPANISAPLFAPVPQQAYTMGPAFQMPQPIIYYAYEQPTPYQFATPPPPNYLAAPYQVGPPQLHPAHQPGPAPAFGLPYPNSTQEAHHPNVLRKKSDITQQIDIKFDDPNSSKDEKKRKGCGLLCFFGRAKVKKSNGRRKTFFITAVLLIVIALCILFALLFTRGNADVDPIESQWLNLSGYPPMPTGISTIARPDLTNSQDRCTTPSTMWSCSLPKEEQSNIGLNDANQPNFRFQIRFRNGTVPASMTRSLNKRATDSSTDDLFTPNPSPAGQPDQIFLGRTTDNVTSPFDGEITPFFITFINTGSAQSSKSRRTRRKLLTRQFNNNSLDLSIPPPTLDTDGTAAPATLLPTTPFPISQPIKLYNRGLQDEHYGFYTYFDKSIFLAGVNIQGSNSSIGTVVPDQNGGSTKQAANVRCTWSQTRFIVKMYTNSEFAASLLQDTTANKTTSQSQLNATSSGLNFQRPGSFPYPTTILLDRHGGNVNKKIVYCYGMANGNIINSAKKLVAEFRSVGGNLVNESPSILQDGNTSFDSSAGGIDGGTGGCGCTWQNWK